ncbi:hypothetical protein [Synechococcus sp. LA31]|nr:hypothetical protein [Synechococcus sp. LA31]QVV67418.1 hypothetical protein KJJ24_13510 [Synechococcus sp. LA31]
MEELQKFLQASRLAGLAQTPCNVWIFGIIRAAERVGNYRFSFVCAVAI